MADHIVNLLLDAIVVHLTTVCQTGVQEDDVTRADIVKKGLLQVDKSKQNISIGVWGGDHEEPKEMDGIITLDKLPDIHFKPPAREVGGGQLWYRRGSVELNCFFVRERLSEANAYIAGYTVLGRVQNNLENIDLTGLIDDWGEKAIKIFSYGNTFFESGGAQNAVIFRGKVYWMCLTERS